MLDLTIDGATGRYKILSGIVGETMTEGGYLLVWKGSDDKGYRINASNVCLVRMMIAQNIYQSFGDLLHFTKFRSAKAMTLELQQLHQRELRWFCPLGGGLFD